MDIYQLSPQKTCRVEKENSTEVCGVGHIRRGFLTHTTSAGVQYHYPGMTSVNFNSELRLPQRRPFLGPEYYNGGCFQLYSNDASQCPSASRLAQTSPRTNAMFEAAFQRPFEPFTGNDAPPSCQGPKYGTYNSVSGWQTNGSSLQWQKL